jgi:hypothetical protein
VVVGQKSGCARTTCPPFSDRSAPIEEIGLLISCIFSARAAFVRHGLKPCKSLPFPATGAETARIGQFVQGAHGLVSPLSLCCARIARAPIRFYFRERAEPAEAGIEQILCQGEPTLRHGKGSI